MDKDLLNKISIATKGSYVGENAYSTLLYSQPVFDDLGRVIMPDNNSTTSTVTVDGRVYYVTIKGWDVTVTDAETKELERFDITPEYAKPGAADTGHAPVTQFDDELSNLLSDVIKKAREVASKHSNVNTVSIEVTGLMEVDPLGSIEAALKVYDYYGNFIYGIE